MSRANWWDEVRVSLAPALPGLRVAVYASGGAPYHHAALVAQWGGVPEPLGAAAIRAGALAAFDVLVMPGGGLNAMQGLCEPLGDRGAARIRSWVEAGGMYVGSCAGACLGAQDLALLEVPLANAGDGDLGALHSPGTGVLRARLSDPAHPLARELPATFEIVHYNGPVFLPDGARVQGVVGLDAPTARFTPWERSLPSADGPTLVERLRTEHAQLVVSGACGEGLVVLFGSHPEFGFSPLQLGWGEAARLFANALLWQAERRSSGNRRAEVSPPASSTLSDTAEQFGRAAQRLRALHDAAPDLSTAPAFLGLAPTALWSAATAEAADLAEHTAGYLRGLASLRPETGPFAHWVDHEAAPGQDYGFVGLAQLAAHLHALLDAATAHLGQPPPAFAHPYDGWDRSPYHLLASSYLSAAGLVASAALAAGTLGRLCGHGTPPPHPLTAPEGVSA